MATYNPSLNLIKLVFTLSSSSGNSKQKFPFSGCDSIHARRSLGMFNALTSQRASESRRRWLGKTGVTHLCSWILRVMTWWTSCSMSATVASGASVTHDRGTGFHLPTWINPEETKKGSGTGEDSCGGSALFGLAFSRVHLWPAPPSCASSPASAGPSRSAG